MKTLLTKIIFTAFTLLFITTSAYAQQNRDLQYYRSPDKTGLNVFEESKDTDVEFDGVKVRIGGSNTLQFQALRHENSGVVELESLSDNFNLATSNLDLDVQLAEGLRMHLRTYLTSQHHNETYVKSGYMQVDKLDFIQEGLFSGLMEKVRIKVGHMQINYGDAHLRRSDNAQAIYNPFVGNYIMDSFTTEVGGEVYYLNNGLLAMAGITNGKLNQSTIETELPAKVSFVGKLGFDTQVNEDLRIRLTGSLYHSPESPYMYLYTGDRAGSRYYNVMEGSFRSGRFNPGFNNQVTAFMFNPFVKFQGFEAFGVLEFSEGKAVAEPDTRSFTQLGAELLYRFGADENFYFGGRYNKVTGDTNAGEEVDISRINVGGGWFLTNNVLAKVEYVTQKYEGFNGGIYEDGKFNGLMLEAVISF